MKQLSLQVLVILQLTACAFAIHGIPRYCNRTIRPSQSARSVYQPTKTTLIAPTCPVNGLTWKQPRFEHVVVFHKRKAPFRLCLTLHGPGIAIHRLRGTSRQPVTTPDSFGSLGCFESHCKHLTLAMKPDGDTQMRRVQFTYTYDKIQTFIGWLKQSFLDSHTGLYRHYFKIAEFIKYNNSYNGRYYAYESHFCSNHSNMFPTPWNTNSFVPTEGVVKVYSKSPLASTDEHFVAGSLHLFRGGRRLILCCVDEDASYAANILREAILRHCEC